MKLPTQSQLVSLARDILFMTLGLAILIDQAFIMATAQPLLIFLGIFFLMSVPFLRGKPGEGTNPFLRLILGLLGVQLPADQGKDGKDEPSHTTIDL